mgnify:CR=1 FL=1
MTFICEDCLADLVISIHIPRVGDDGDNTLNIRIPVAISIHIPRVGDDRNAFSRAAFLRYFNPHPPCGG